MLNTLTRKLKERIDSVRFLTTKAGNSIYFTALKEDIWVALPHILEVFRTYPIVMGDWNEDFAYIQVIEKLPSTEVKGLLPAISKRRFPALRTICWIDEQGITRRAFV